MVFFFNPHTACQSPLLRTANKRQRTLDRTVEFSFNLPQFHPHLPPSFCHSCLGFCCTHTQKEKKLCIFFGSLYYGDLGKVSSRGINCRIPRTSERRGADSEKRAREHCCFGSLTGFVSTGFSFSFFFLFSPLNHIGITRETNKHSQRAFEPFSLDVWIYKRAHLV